MQESDKVKLLLVDDNEANLVAMQATLEELGEELVLADSGKKALRLLLDDEFAVVLLDVDMPMLDGFEVAALMRQVNKLQHTPIIFLTALYQNESHVFKGYALGAVDYILKPFEPEILKAKVRFFIDLYRKRMEIQRQSELLRETNQKLDNLNLTLERRVEERTGRLRQAVADLEREIAERKRVEKEREDLLVRERSARAEAERANRLKDEFLATLSHELRTPMNSILGWITVLNNDRTNMETTSRALETIERNAKVQAQLIEDILDVSSIITGKFQLQTEPITLDPIVHAAADMLRPAMEAKNLTLRLEMQGEPVPVLGDATRLQQAVWNLLSNAVKFSAAAKEIVVTLQQEPDMVCLRVRDSGQGISPEFLPYVFDRFRQADGSTTRKHGGLGLGLAIVRHIIETHGGRVAAESKGTGQGATFTISLPKLTARSTGQKEKGSSTGEETSVPDSAIMLDGVRVLLVDDQLDTRELLCFLLKQRNAEIEAVSTVREAMAVLKDWHPHVVVSDLGMPDEDGYSLITQMRSLIHGSQIPALALTGYALDEERKRALATGFQAFLTKPVDADDLINTVAGLAYNDAGTVN